MNLDSILKTAYDCSWASDNFKDRKHPSLIKTFIRGALVGVAVGAAYWLNNENPRYITDGVLNGISGENVIFLTRWAYHRYFEAYRNRT